MPTIFKLCPRCETNKRATSDNFNKNRSKPDGLQSICRACQKKARDENKEAIAKRKQEYSRKNKSKIAAYKQEHYEKNKDGIRAKTQKRYSENKEKASEKRKEYYRKNKKSILDANKRLRQSKKPPKPPALPVRQGHKRCTKCLVEKPATSEYFRNFARQLDGLSNICKKCAPKFTKFDIEKVRESKRKYAQSHPEQGRAHMQRRLARKRNLPDSFTAQDWNRLFEYFGHKCAACGNGDRLHADHWIPLASPSCPGTIPTNMIVLCDRCNPSKSNRPAVEWLESKFGKRKAKAILARINAYFAWVKDAH